MKKVLITVSGRDHPGITSGLMDIVVKSGESICDMGQAVTHGLLSLSFVLELQAGGREVLKELLFAADQSDLRLDYKELKDSTPKLAPSGMEFVLTCVSRQQLSAKFVGDVAEVLAKCQVNITRINNLSPVSFHSLEMVTSLPERASVRKIKSELLRISTEHAVDVAFLKENVYRRSKRLVVFDMDSTLIQGEIIDELALLAGKGEEVKKITEAAMNGKIDFKESLRERVKMLKGLALKDLENLLERIPLTEGCAEFVATLANLGYKTALISGGFSFFANQLRQRLKLDYAFSNELEVVDGALTGKLKGEIVDAEQKATLLKMIAQQERIALEQTVAIGDGANDLPMLNVAGLGIAFHAKGSVRDQAPQSMGHGPLTSILYFLGIVP